MINKPDLVWNYSSQELKYTFATIYSQVRLRQTNEKLMLKTVMKPSELSKKTINELKAKLRVYKVVSFSFVTVLLFFTVFSIYGLIVKEDTSTSIALFAVVCSCCSFLPIPFNSMRKIKSEFKMTITSN